jgi:rhodanese-related sulfurtransferase
MVKTNDSEALKCTAAECCCADSMQNSETAGNQESLQQSVNPCDPGSCAPECACDFSAYSDLQEPVQAAPGQIAEDITPSDTVDMIDNRQNDPDMVILDVSTEGEFLGWHLEGSINMDFFSEQFREELDALDRSKKYIVFCKMGVRSKFAQNLMIKLGFKETYNVAGGRDRWQAEGLPHGVRSA